jgi:peptidoglycan/LPS O-acetylase OafA/YrhL
MNRTIKSLKGMRGAAALLIVAYHMQFALPGLTATKNGYLAVDLFFVLSGFVTCHAYGAKITDHATLRIFLVRRFGRLWPVYVVTTLLYYGMFNLPYLFASLSLSSPSDVHWVVPTTREALAQLTLMQSLGVFNDYVGNAVSWSISCEFYVYLVFGAACIVFRGRYRVVAFSALAIAGFAVTVWASIAVRDCLYVGHCIDVTYDYGFFRCLAGFFTGALAAAFGDTLAVHCGPVAQIGVFVIAATFANYTDVLPVIALAAPLVFAALIASLASDNGPVSRLLQTRAVQYLGRVSYSLYLGHGVFRAMLHVYGAATTGTTAHVVVGALYLFASLALAHLLNRFVETPCRIYFNRLSSGRLSSRAYSPPSKSHNAQ